MLLKDLKKVYIFEYTETNNYGEKEKTWTSKGSCYLNMQQDLDELDAKSTGDVDYSIWKGRSDKPQNIKKGNAISFTSTSPEFKVTDINNIGNTYVYRMTKINEN